MAFEHAHPEAAHKTPASRMRRIDLCRAAAAYDIYIDHSAVADRIRQTIVDQEAMGTFQKPCPHPERLTAPGYAAWSLAKDPDTKMGTTAKDAEIAELKAQLASKDGGEGELVTGETKWRGPQHKWCRMVDGEWITGFGSKEAATEG